MPFSPEQIIFLINPYSGQGKYKHIVASLIKADSSIQYHISESKNEIEAFFFGLNKRFKVVVICGGDGTINSVLKYAVNSDLIFAVLPTGSGNGFAREIGYTTKIDELIAAIKRGKTRKIDVLKVNDYYCCNMAGIGFDGFIAKQFDQGKTRGLFNYVREVLKGLLKFTYLNATILSNDVEAKGNYFMLSIANTRQFGNNFTIAPQALPDDGLLELVIVKKFSKILIPLIIIRLLSKKGKNSKYIEYRCTKEIVITSDYKYFHVDGEPRTNNNTKLYIRIEGTMNMITTNK